MAAAAARAALVAMQTKQKKKDNIIKSLVEKNKLDDEKRDNLHSILKKNKETQFIVNISQGKRAQHSDSVDQVQEFVQPFNISDKHYHILKKFFKTEPEIRGKWVKGYITSLKNPFSNRISPDDDITFDKLTRIHYINELILYTQFLANDKYFNGAILLSIIAAGVLVGIQSYPSMNHPAFEGIDILIQVIFSVECIVKILAEGKRPTEYWKGSDWRWNNFDFWLVFFCWIPIGGNVAFLRLLRLMRLLKLVSKIKQLQVIVMGLIKGLSAVTYIILLMLLIFYLFAVMGVVSFRNNDPYHWGSLGVAMLSLFRAATLEDWADLMYINWFGCDSHYSGIENSFAIDDDVGYETKAGIFPPLHCDHPSAQPYLSAFFFITFILIAAFVTMALFVGAVTGGMYEALDDFKEEEEKERIKLEKEEEEKEMEEERNFSGGNNNLYDIKSFKAAFDAVDSDCSGLIDEFELKHAMNLMGVDVSIDIVKEIMNDVDKDKNGGLDFHEFLCIMTEGQDPLSEDEIMKGPPITKQKSLNFKPPPPLKKSLSEFELQEKARLEEEEASLQSMKLAAHIRKAWRGEVNTSLFDNKSNQDKDAESMWRKCYCFCAIKAEMICSDERFTHFITFTILAAGVVVGLQTEADASSPALDALDGVILAIFTLEVILKVMAEGDEPLRYFDDSWNCFDAFIVGACFIFMLPFMPDVGSMLAMLRLLRLLRVLKLVKALPQLRIITVALISGFGSISFVTLMLFLLFYLFANIAIIFFGKNDPMHFGNLQLSLMSLFVIATLDDWTDIMYINMLGCDKYGYEYGPSKYGFNEQKNKDSILNCSHPKASGWIAALFMVIFVVLGSFVMLNLFIGIVSTAMEQAKADTKTEADIYKRLKQRSIQLKLNKHEIKLYENVFNALDTKKVHKLEHGDLKKLVRCLPVLHFATVLLSDDHKHKHQSDSSDVPFKVMNKRDIDNYMQCIDLSYYGSIELPEFIVLMDFMRRVDEVPSLLYSFREAYDQAINEDDDHEQKDDKDKICVFEQEEEKSSSSSSSRNSSRNSSSSSREGGGDLFNETLKHRTQSNEMNNKIEYLELEIQNKIKHNNKLEKEIEISNKKNELIKLDYERAKLRIHSLEERIAHMKTQSSQSLSLDSSLKMVNNKIKKTLSSNWTMSSASSFRNSGSEIDDEIMQLDENQNDMVPNEIPNTIRNEITNQNQNKDKNNRIGKGKKVSKTQSISFSRSMPNNLINEDNVKNGDKKPIKRSFSFESRKGASRD
mmetsp:Transcript_28177/g.33391  ORF Transcript_28177/g.33391 Transcript_28177/m.33391 type:complete len:1260 (+) Transcript_28177:99-3878(+)